MMPLEVVKHRNQIDARIKRIDEMVPNVDDFLQNVLASHLLLLSAGYLEKSFVYLLQDYSSKRGNKAIQRFVKIAIGRQNSIGCEKIENVLNNFDKDWWSTLLKSTSDEERAAVDSVKALRDSIAHGGVNGTGYLTIKQYDRQIKTFIIKVAELLAS
jgi:RiboL-PSP-HEPN